MGGGDIFALTSMSPTDSNVAWKEGLVAKKAPLLGCHKSVKQPTGALSKQSHGTVGASSVS